MKVFNNDYTKILEFGKFNSWDYHSMVSCRIEENVIVCDMSNNIKKNKGEDLTLYYWNVTKSEEYNKLTEIEKKYITSVYNKAK